MCLARVTLQSVIFSFRSNGRYLHCWSTSNYNFEANAEANTSLSTYLFICLSIYLMPRSLMEHAGWGVHRWCLQFSLINSRQAPQISLQYISRLTLLLFNILPYSLPPPHKIYYVYIYIHIYKGSWADTTLLPNIQALSLTLFSHLLRIGLSHTQSQLFFIFTNAFY